MADYDTSVRSNYFHVVDDALFMDFMSRVVVDGDEIDVMTRDCDDGGKVCAFATHGLIIGVSDDDETDEAVCFEDCYGNFLNGLQELVADGDAVIILEVGNARLRDVYAGATIVTSDGTEYVDLQELASAKAIEMLGRTSVKE